MRGHRIQAKPVDSLLDKIVTARPLGVVSPHLLGFCATTGQDHLVIIAEIARVKQGELFPRGLSPPYPLP